MNTTTEDTIMKHGLSPAKQNAMLSTRDWLGDSRVKVPCTHHTEPLLRAAGVSRPQAMVSYAVPVKRDKSGFLVLDSDGARAPQVAGDDGLFHPGGLFAGAAPGQAGNAQRTEIPRAFLLDTSAAIHARRFEVAAGDKVKIRVEVVAYEDDSLPSPCEPEQWRARDASDEEIRAAVAALHMSRVIKYLER